MKSHTAGMFSRMFYATLAISLWMSAAGAADDLQLTVPRDLYAVVGHPISVYFDNLVLSPSSQKYQFQISSDLGSLEQRRWHCVPEAGHVGAHVIKVEVRDAAGKSIAEGATVLHVSPADAGSSQRLRLLLVGDSLTHATVYPNALAARLRAPGNPKWEMLGTHRPTQAAAGVSHEGYGGWTWERFVSYSGDPAPPAGRPAKSPFVFLGADGKPMLDVERYLAEHCQGQSPDVVFFLLGINDCFGANPDDQGSMDKRIETMLANADQLLKAFHRASPQADLAIGLTTPPNVREEAFVANYKGQYHQWGWKRIQHRLVQRQMEHFTGREADRIFVVPTEVNLDPIDGYPVDNAVHPNALGYEQIADSIYAWLKFRSTSAR